MASEPYLEDAKKLIGFAASLIREKMSADETLQALIFFAIGIEKLLKHGLLKINPLFIQQSPDFKHSAAIYRDRFIHGYTGSEVEKTPNQDVITFRASLGRLKVFSKAADRHSQLLHTIASWRDTAFHRPSSEIDLDAISRMLRKDAVPVIEDFCSEFGEDVGQFLGPDAVELRWLSQRLIKEQQLDVEVTALLEHHRKQWEVIRTNPAMVEQAEKATERAAGEMGTDFSNEKVPCPACSQDAVVRIEPQYDYADGEGYLAGVYADSLVCFFCGLGLNGYEQLDYINIDELLSRNY